MKFLQWGTIISGIVAAIAAAFVLDWWKRKSGLTCATTVATQANLAAKNLPPSPVGPDSTMQNANPGIYESSVSPGFEAGPISAYAFNTGAPTPTYRPTTQIGTLTVETQ